MGRTGVVTVTSRGSACAQALGAARRRRRAVHARSRRGRRGAISPSARAARARRGRSPRPSPVRAAIASSERPPRPRRARARRLGSSGSAPGRAPRGARPRRRAEEDRRATSSAPRMTARAVARAGVAPGGQPRGRRGPAPRRPSRPRSAAKSAVISEPERSAASTTTVSSRQRGHDPVARREASSATARAPGGSSETTAPLARPARRARGWRAGRRTSAPHASTAIVRPAAVERTAVGGGVDPERQAAHHGHAGRRQPAAELVADLQPVAGGASRADDGDRRLVRAARRRRVERAR